MIEFISLHLDVNTFRCLQNMDQINCQRINSSWKKNLVFLQSRTQSQPCWEYSSPWIIQVYHLKSIENIKTVKNEFSIDKKKLTKCSKFVCKCHPFILDCPDVLATPHTYINNSNVMFHDFIAFFSPNVKSGLWQPERKFSTMPINDRHLSHQKVRQKISVIISNTNPSLQTLLFSRQNVNQNAKMNYFFNNIKSK